MLDKQQLAQLPGASLLNDIRKWVIGILKGSFSQNGEDIILMNFFNKAKGFYVDIGANHPFKLNNTYSLYRKGWRGITIEPMPFQHSLLKKWRPRDIHLNIGVGRNTELLTFTILNPHVLSTFDSRIANRLINNGEAKLIQKCKISVQPLKEILHTHIESCSFDLLCIDTEGFDLEVLLSNDWELFRPTLIVVERVSPGQDSPEATIQSFLELQNYELYSETLHNAIFRDTKYS